MPVFLNYGYHLATPMDSIHDSQSIAVEGVNVFKQRVEKTVSRASQMLQRAQERQKIQANRKRREQVFHIGE